MNRLAFAILLRIWGKITSAYPSPLRGRGQGEGAENAAAIFPLILIVIAGCGPADASFGEGPAATAEVEDAKRPANRLVDETSPYLLMHSHNPVDWFPWGQEAFQKAKAEGKLIFLSIGYSSCYWCHVMERESFMDPEIAATLNEHFISVKVDREERPDVDEVYMTALHIYFQVIGSPQGGGWPLSMFLTPDAKPIMGGTYFPPRDAGGRTGFLTLLERLQQSWENDSASVTGAASKLAEIVRRQLEDQPPPESLPGREHLDDVLAELARQYDPEHGGFGYSVVNPRIPKFPEPSNLVFLLDRALADEKAETTGVDAKSMLVRTLERMAAGGIRDHVGGGFHRYSTDRYWHIPHFEKMLYDNGQLASVYAEAFRLTGREDFRSVVDEILAFVLREMTGPEGGFYSALDAETDGEEGVYYAWKTAELEALLDDEAFGLVADAYGIRGEGNFEGSHVLLLGKPLQEIADSREVSLEALDGRLALIRQKLFAARGKCARPRTDTKVLTAWNGLMIRGFADAGRLLQNPEYIAAAQEGAEFVLDKLATPDGRLLRSYRKGEAKLNGYLDDYAFFIDGLIALEKATGDRRWLKESDRLMAQQIELFWDEKHGGFFFTSSDHETLLAKSKDPADSVLPSGNAVSVDNLIYLADAADKPEFKDRAEKTVQAFRPMMTRLPGAMPRMAVALARLLETKGE